MNSFQSLSQETFPCQKANSLGYHECCHNISAKEKYFAGPVTFLRDSLPSRGSMPRAEELAGKSNLAGSSFYGNADSGGYSGNSRSVSPDDAQVVPDFDDLIETISNSRVLQEEPLQTSSLRRGNSERDELDIYFPCVLTPIPVDNLYSTLNEDSSVFKFPLSADEVVLDDNVESLNSLSVVSFSDITPVNFLAYNDSHDKTKGSGNQCLQVPLFLKAEQDSSQGEGQRHYKDNMPIDISWNEERNFTLLSPKSRNVFNFQMPFICRFSPVAEKKEQSCCSADLSTHERNPSSIDGFVVHMPNPKLLDDSNPSKQSVSFDKSLDNRNHDNPYDKCAYSQISFMRRGGRKPSLCSRQSLEAGSSGQSPHLKGGKSLLSNRGNTKQTRNQQKNIRKRRPQVSECELRHTETRDIHNDMEKQRRTNMKTRFQKLRMVVPGLSGSAKASKIVILRNALDYINALEKESINLENVKRAERQRNTELLEKLQKITSGSC